MLLLANGLPSPATLPATTTAPAMAAAMVTRHADDTQPHVIVSSLIVRAKRFTRYNPPGAKEPVYGTWSWVPDFEFYMRGPLEGGSQITVNFQKPNGAPWLSVPVETPEINAGDSQKITCPDFDEHQAIVPVGLVPFQIILKNSLTGAKKVLFSGKADVRKFKYKYDKAPGAFEFYVDQDWMLPMGFLAVNTELSSEAPMLEARIWVKNINERDNTVAVYVLYNGQPIASSKHMNDAMTPDQINVSDDRTISTAGMTNGDPEWRRLLILMTKIRVNGSTNAVYPTHYLDKNPGVYEIRVMKSGQPVCSAKFTVGADGKIVDDGRGKALGTIWTFLPVHHVKDGLPASPTSYKTGAFYGNPLPGFVAP